MSGPTTMCVAANLMDIVTVCRCKWILVQSGTCCNQLGEKQTPLEHVHHRQRILSLSLTLGGW